MPIHKITQSRLDRLLAGRRPGRHSDGGNLYLQITKRGSASWIFRYQLPGDKREKCLGLGAVSVTTLDQARQDAQAARRQLFQGRDPLGARAGRTKTFTACFREFFASYGPSIASPKARRQYAAAVERHVIPIIGSVPIDQINEAHVLRVVEPLWAAKTETARRLRERIEKVLDWAKVKGFRTGDNCAAWALIGKVLPSPKAIAPVKHHAALDYKELPPFIAQLRELQGPARLDLRALEFVILTAVRTGDVIGQRSEARPPLTWADVDLERGEWKIPACKVDKPHTVALSGRAVAILREVRGMQLPGDWVFPIGKDAMRQALREIAPAATVHGMRSAFRSWAHAATSFPRELVEEALSHRLIGDQVELAYLRTEALEKRRTLMAAWADHCDGRAADNVVPISKVA